MDTCIQSNSGNSIAGWGQAPLVLLAAGPHAAERARGPIEAAGFRTAITPVDGLSQRVAEQANAAALWIETDGDEGDRFDAEVGAAAADRRFPLVLSGPQSMIDRMASIAPADSEILVNATDAERVAALALLNVRHAAPARLNDVSAEPSAARLRQLSDEVGRIAATLARLSSGPGGVTVEKPAPVTDGSAPSVSGDTVRQIIRARRMRARFFDAELFADPAWDMLLDLLQAEIAQHRVPVSSLCIAADVPPTTALRWIKSMTDAGLFLRRADPHDGRRVFIELSASASDAMRRYFREVGASAAI